MYKVIELIGTSSDSWEKAAAAAVEQAGLHLRDLRVAEIAELDMSIKDGKVENYRANMERRLRESGLEIPLDDDRLVREVGIFAERCDITEEITRLESHLKQFARYLESDEPVGRAMDFLSQELFPVIIRILIMKCFPIITPIITFLLWF